MEIPAAAASTRPSERNAWWYEFWRNVAGRAPVPKGRHSKVLSVTVRR